MRHEQILVGASERQRQVVRIWLYVVATLVIIMVVVGGATRLTDSGLSIVEWRPVTGTLPPLSETAWLGEFEKYKTSPEYEIVNRGMSLDEFKRIYWWEWGHRFLGRVIGAVFLLPFLVFLWRGWIERRLKWRLWLIFGLGGLQGAVGWWMVASGLVGRVDVAAERLATHLTLACLILLVIVWTARGLEPGPRDSVPRLAVVLSVVITALIVVQIALGGLVAGLKAGLVYDTWPLIDGALIPSRERLFFVEPAWRNLIDNHLTAQFLHRMVAYALILLTVCHAIYCMRTTSGEYRALAVVLAGLIVLQAALGILTLLWHVPLPLALAHQAVAFVALVVSTAHARRLCEASRAVRRASGLGGATLRAHFPTNA
jgi:cytochrome c oxidase assembly protein subunit 15